MRYFTTYWKCETWGRHSSFTAQHTASNQYRSRNFGPGDVVYFMTVRKGQLYVGSCLVVDRVADRQTAIQHLDEPDLWDAADHVLAKKAEPFFKDCAVPLQTVRQLRFLPEGSLVFKTRDQIDRQTLRGIREVIADSARLLDQVLRKFKNIGSPAKKTAVGIRLPQPADDTHSSGSSDTPFTSSGEEPGPGDWTEANRVSVLVDRAERNPRARAACIKIHGLRCQVCAMRFDEWYGDVGKDFIHVHHREPLAATDAARRVNPERDLVPVCANCHAMLHRKEPPYTVEELRQYFVARRTVSAIPKDKDCDSIEGDARIRRMKLSCAEKSPRDSIIVATPRGLIKR